MQKPEIHISIESKTKILSIGEVIKQLLNYSDSCRRAWRIVGHHARSLVIDIYVTFPRGAHVTPIDLEGRQQIVNSSKPSIGDRSI